MTFMFEMLGGAVRRLAALDAEAFRIFWFTLQIGLVGTLLGVLAALPLAWWIFGLSPRWKTPVLIAFQMLLSVPTVIVGTLVYLVISRRGPLGALEMMFTPSGIVIGEVMLIVPLVTVFLHSSLAQIPGGLVETARNLGYRGMSLLRLLVRECRAGVGVAFAVGFGRVVSEVGVAMILGGNIKGYTRTLTTAIALETAKGDTELALALGMLLLAVALGNALLVQAIQMAAGRRASPEVDAGEPSAVPAVLLASLPEETGTVPEIAPIELQGVTLTFADRDLFRGLSASLPLTGGVALSGPSGSGKTTLLRMVAGLVPPAAGRVGLGGRRAVLVSQRPFLFHGTVVDNLKAAVPDGSSRGWSALARPPSGSQPEGRGGPETVAGGAPSSGGIANTIASPERPIGGGGGGSPGSPGVRPGNGPMDFDDEASVLASDLGIAHLLNRDVGTLSGGEAARVSLGRALLAAPDILLIDEALGHLDEGSLKLVVQVLQQYVRAGGGLVLVTHDGVMGRRLCRHRFRLDSGKLHPEA